MQNMEILKKYASTNHFGQFIGLKLEVVKPDINYYVKVKKDHWLHTNRHMEVF